MTNNVLFWITFAGVCMFIVNAIHNAFVLRLTKTKEYPYSEFVTSVIFAMLTILFVVMSLEYKIKANTPTIIKDPSPYIELHQRLGEIEYDGDTITIFIEEKDLPPIEDRIVTP